MISFVIALSARSEAIRDASVADANATVTPAVTVPEALTLEVAGRFNDVGRRRCVIGGRRRGRSVGRRRVGDRGAQQRAAAARAPATAAAASSAVKVFFMIGYLLKEAPVVAPVVARTYEAR